MALSKKEVPMMLGFRGFHESRSNSNCERTLCDLDRTTVVTVKENVFKKSASVEVPVGHGGHPEVTRCPLAVAGKLRAI